MQAVQGEEGDQREQDTGGARGQGHEGRTEDPVPRRGRPAGGWHLP